MTWHMVNCTICGTPFPSLNPVDHPCDDTNLHYKLAQQAKGGGSSSTVVTGKKGRVPPLEGAGQGNAGKGKDGCLRAAALILIALGGIGVGLVEVVKAVVA
jgi:hypothetical protein